MRLHLEPRHEAVVHEILRSTAPECDVWAFGSRAHGRGLKPFSDLDLAVIGGGDALGQRCAALRRAFEDSNLPFRVDVVEWASLDEAFRELIRRDSVVVQKALAPVPEERKAG
jgi:type I restriction enzyme S subunit